MLPCQQSIRKKFRRQNSRQVCGRYVAEPGKSPSKVRWFQWTISIFPGFCCDIFDYWYFGWYYTWTRQNVDTAGRNQNKNGNLKESLLKWEWQFQASLNNMRIWSNIPSFQDNLNIYIYIHIHLYTENSRVMIEHGDVTINSLGISIGHIEQSITDKGEPGFSSWDSFHCQFLTTILSMFNYSGGRKKNMKPIRQSMLMNSLVTKAYYCTAMNGNFE